jgi:DnaJ family protein C protein 13
MNPMVCWVLTSTLLCNLDTCPQDCAAIGRPLFSLFQHPSAAVADGATLLMAAIAGAGAEAAEPLREAALAEGAVLTHLHRALFSTSGSQALLSRQVCLHSWLCNLITT